VAQVSFDSGVIKEEEERRRRRTLLATNRTIK